MSALPPLPIELEGCPEWSRDVEPLLRLELDALARERHRTEPPDVAAIRVVCAEQAITVRVVTDGDATTVALDPATVASDAVGRTVALKTAELIDALWSRAPSVSPPPDAPEVVTQPPPPAPPAPKRPVTLHLGPFVSLAGRPLTPLEGGRLGLEWPAHPQVFFVAELTGAGGRAHPSPAPVDLALGATSAHVLVGQSAARGWRWGVGPGGTLGWARLRGAPDDDQLAAATVSGVWGGPSLGARVSRALGSRARVGAALEAGLFTLPVIGTVDDDAVYSLDGAWLAASVMGGVELERP